MVLLASCTSNTMVYTNSTALIQQQHWQQKNIQTDDFVLASFEPRQLVSKNDLTIYIEGDGRAWQSRDNISSNPTPSDPVGFKLALNAEKSNRVYLARPCQYTPIHDQKKCTPKLWTQHRFSYDVIKAMNEAISIIALDYQPTSLTLIGYSGGGVIATLLANSRDDVGQLITIAAPLDHDAWTNYHQVSPLEDSINPAELSKVKCIPQTHYFGTNDEIVPLITAIKYLNRLASCDKASIIEIDVANHHNWPSLELAIP